MIDNKLIIMLATICDKANLINFSKFVLTGASNIHSLFGLVFLVHCLLCTGILYIIASRF